MRKFDYCGFARIHWNGINPQGSVDEIGTIRDSRWCSYIQTEKRIKLVMKTQIKPLIRFLPLLALLSAPHLASAYYDPGVQRWINRDPLLQIEFRAFTRAPAPVTTAEIRTYVFVRNQPLTLVDPLGLSPCTDACDQDARNRNQDVDCYAKYGGLAGLGGGAILGGFLNAGKGRAGSGAIVVGVLAGAANYLGIELLGTAYSAARWFACLAKCSITYSGPYHPEWPNPL